MLLHWIVAIMLVSATSASSADSCQAETAQSQTSTKDGLSNQSTWSAWLGDSSLHSHLTLPLLAIVSSAPIAMLGYLITRARRTLNSTFYTTITVESDKFAYDWFSTWLQDQPQVVQGETQVELVEQGEVR
jgi:hypothetical protein